LACLLAAASCDDGATGATATSTTLGPTGGTGGLGGAGGDGGDGGHEHGCMDPALDCPAPPNECVNPICAAGICSTENLAQGIPLANQTPGDCQEAVCDGNGGLESEADGTDVDDDMVDCTLDTCEDGTPMHAPAAEGLSCDDGGGSVCNDSGTCVECNVTEDCQPGDLCQQSQCVPPSCLDMMQNGPETDVDCGGPVCAPCDDGEGCMIDGDCVSDFCNPNLSQCAAPTCLDGFENGVETDVDCGGGTCPDCVNGNDCLLDTDCVSSFCHPVSLTCQTPSCMDGVQNQDETDVDCGGSICAANCAAGQSCVTSADCTDQMCHAGTCFATINGCDIDTATDLTGMSSTSVTFNSFFYSPPCIRVSQGTAVIFIGSFASHPLVGGYVDAMMLFPQGSGPFFPTTNMGTTKSVTMSQTGTFPYYCQFHGSGGMFGAVFVVP
jgi:plastocyanin